MSLLQTLIALSIIYFASAGKSRPSSEDFCAALPRNHPSCKPRNLGQKIVSCEALGKPVAVGGGLYSNWEFHYNLIMSPYYAYRMADALGYDDCCPGRNSTFLNGMNLVTPWSGTHGAIAIDGLYGFDRSILRRCDFPTGDYPFICRGSAGTPGTQGRELGTLSYIALLHDEVDHKWTLFGQCWNAKTPQNPNAQPIATSFNVFSLDSTLPSAEVRDAIIAKIESFGFNADDIIEPDFTGNPVAPQC